MIASPNDHISPPSTQLLSDREVEMLHERANPYIFPFLFAIVFCSLGLLALTFTGVDTMSVLWISGTSLFTIVVTNRFFKTRTKIRLDLTGGQKHIWQATLEAKREEASGYSSNYYCTVSGEEFEISFAQWKDLQPSQWVELHMAPHSRYVFAVTAIAQPVQTPINP